MTGTDLAILAGVFLGGATPWLEAIVVIPGGIIAGANTFLVVLAGIIGNLITVALAAWFGERIMTWWNSKRRSKNPEAGPSKSRARVERIMNRWGMPALAVLGPIGLGTQISAVVAVALGVSARRSFLWIAAGTVVWAIAAAFLTLGGLSIAGIGA